MISRSVWTKLGLDGNSLFLLGNKVILVRNVLQNDDDDTDIMEAEDDDDDLDEEGIGLHGFEIFYGGWIKITDPRFQKAIDDIGGM